MPQSNHKTLIQVLLWWTAFLSICQVALLVLFFTTGHFGQSQNGDAQESPIHSDKHSDKWHGNSHDKAKVFTYKARKVINHTITWYAVNTKDLPTDGGDPGDLRINKDGSFFLCLRITLAKCSRSEHRCNEVDEVNLLKNNETILTGWINDKTLSTGLLCKAERLFSNTTLRVLIKSKNPGLVKIQIQDTQNVSSLDIICMPD